MSSYFCEAMAKLWVATEGSRVSAVWLHWASLHYMLSQVYQLKMWL